MSHALARGSRVRPAWAAQYHVPVFCGEFGVYRNVAPPDRLRWISDVRRTLESLGIGWSMWDYETDFGLVTFSEPSWRRGVRVDTDCLAALGLDSTQTLAPQPGESTAAAFSAGAVRALDIPIDTWTALWTRDPGAGEASAVYDSDDLPDAFTVTHRGTLDWALATGLQIAVAAGEHLTLSSRASREGTGVLKMEFVARDASGTVLDWSYGGVSVPVGSEQAVETDVTVGKGIASLEPRWSGSGPMVAVLKDFQLARR